LTRDKVDLHYISGDNLHLTNRFFEDELSLNSLPNIVSELILARFVGSIVSPAISPLSDNPKISSFTHEMFVPWREEGMLEIPHQLELGQFTVYKWR